MVGLTTLFFGAAWRGVPEASVRAQLGPPTSQLSAGPKAIWIYDGQGSLHFRNGVVERVQGDFPTYQGSPPDGAGTAGPTAIGPATRPGASVSRGFRAPKATIVTEPGFEAEGTWGGLSDGKTIGADGQPLSDHQIYSIDSKEFIKRMRRGMETLEGRSGTARRRDLDRYLGASDADRRRAAEAFSETYGYPPERDPLFAFARFARALEAAIQSYSYARSQLLYLEQLTVSDRIDLDAAATGEGQTRREEMKAAIEEMERIRARWQGHSRRYFTAGQQSRPAERRSPAGGSGPAVRADDTPCFLYASFERTPLALGLAMAERGELLARARPVLLPAGTAVQVVERKTIQAPANAPVPGKPLKILKVSFNAAGARQHDGRNLPAMALEGWVLEQAVR